MESLSAATPRHTLRFRVRTGHSDHGEQDPSQRQLSTCPVGPASRSAPGVYLVLLRTSPVPGCLLPHVTGGSPPAVATCVVRSGRRFSWSVCLSDDLFHWRTAGCRGKAEPRSPTRKKDRRLRIHSYMVEDGRRGCRGDSEKILCLCTP